MGVTGIGPGFEVGSAGSNLGNLFQPGVMTGTQPVFTMLTANTAGYNPDKNNLAPSVGVAWTVGSDKGILSKILGKPGDSVLRAGYSIAYQRPGTSDFTQIYGSNPGVSIDATRNQTNGNLGTLPGPDAEQRPRAAAAQPDADLPDGAAEPEHERLRVRPGHPGPALADGERRHPAGTRQDDDGGSPLHPHQQLGRVDEQQRVGVPRLQRGERHRERLRHRVPGGAGQPAGEHRGGQGQHLRLHGRGGHAAAADLRGVHQRRPEDVRGRPGQVHGQRVDELHDARLHVSDEPERAVGGLEHPHQRHLQDERADRGSPGQLLRGQPGRQQRLRDDERTRTRGTTACSSC